jgi:ferredoxin
MPSSPDFRVAFAGSQHPPVRLSEGSDLSECLTVHNSPVLFGCRTGVCGTCLIEVEEEANGALAAATDEEREVLDVIAPGNSRARLGCQVRLQADIRIKYLGNA